MHGRSSRSLAFRLWFALSCQTVAATLLLLGVFLLVAILQQISNARSDTTAKVQAVVATAQRTNALASDGNTPDLATGRSLGIELIELIEPGGRVTRSISLRGGVPQNQSLQPKEMNAALAGFSEHHSVRIKSGASRSLSLSP